MISILRLLLRLLFRFRAYNTEALRAPGPVLILPNHTSWWDWLFLGVCLDKDWRFVTSATTAKLSWLHRFIMVNRRTFPVENNSPYAVKYMAEYLQKGGRLVLSQLGRRFVRKPDRELPGGGPGHRLGLPRDAGGSDTLDRRGTRGLHPQGGERRLRRRAPDRRGDQGDHPLHRPRRQADGGAAAAVLNSALRVDHQLERLAVPVE